MLTATIDRMAQTAVAPALLVRLFALRGWADPQRVAAYPHHWTWMGQFDRFLRIAADEGCREVAFIGSVSRPSLWKLRPDLRVLRLMPQIVRLYRGGDDHLQSGIGKLFEQYGFRLVGPREIAPELTMPLGPLGSRTPKAYSPCSTSSAPKNVNQSASPGLPVA